MGPEAPARPTPDSSLRQRKSVSIRVGRVANPAWTGGRDGGFEPHTPTGSSWGLSVARGSNLVEDCDPSLDPRTTSPRTARPGAPSVGPCGLTPLAHPLAQSSHAGPTRARSRVHIPPKVRREGRTLRRCASRSGPRPLPPGPLRRLFSRRSGPRPGSDNGFCIMGRCKTFTLLLGIWAYYLHRTDATEEIYSTSVADDYYHSNTFAKVAFDALPEE